MLKMKTLEVIIHFYYGMAEVETEEGLLNYLYQIQEGTEYLNSPVDK